MVQHLLCHRSYLGTIQLYHVVTQVRNSAVNACPLYFRNYVDLSFTVNWDSNIQVALDGNTSMT